MPRNPPQSEELFAPILELGPWSFWSFRHEELSEIRPRSRLPKLNGTYLLDGGNAPLYFGASGNICCRLINHNQSWESAICITLKTTSLSSEDRDHIEYATGLVLLLTGTTTKNRRLDYAKQNAEGIQLAQSFLQDALMPFLTSYGSEFGMRGRNTKTAVNQALRLLGLSARYESTTKTQFYSSIKRCHDKTAGNASDS